MLDDLRTRKAHTLLQRSLAAAMDESRARLTDASLASGCAGSAVFIGTVAQISGNPLELSAAVNHLDHSFELVRSSHMDASLFSGVAGVAWAVEYLRRLDLRAFSCYSCREVDDFLIDYLRAAPIGLSFDLVSGLVGIGVYALHRMPRPSARSLCELVVRRLGESSITLPVGIAWHRPNIGGEGQSVASSERYDCGMAHGIAGVIALLSRMIRAGVVLKTATRLIDDSVAWLLQQESVSAGFPNWIDSSGMTAPQRSRIAWCYGDLGVSHALLLAARIRQRHDWTCAALRAARRATNRKPSESCVSDPWLCHGAAGACHGFQRLYHTFGEKRFRTAALIWFDVTQKFFDYGHRSVSSGHPHEDDAINVTGGLIRGSCGLGLTMLTAISKTAPLWDGWILL